MFFALDKNNSRTYIDNIEKDTDYFCPVCKDKLDIKYINQKAFCFCHRSENTCTDSWQNDRISLWEKKLQNLYPINNREIIIKSSEDTHMADIMLGRTVVLFCDGAPDSVEFLQKNTFFENCGLKVIWLVNLSSISSCFKVISSNGCLTFKWQNPSNSFLHFEPKMSNVDLFFYFSENSIFRVLDFRNGFTEFDSTSALNIQDFLYYTGFKSSLCPAPIKVDSKDDAQYMDFKTKYNIKLNQQQERAVRCIDGANLLLAVPGSGKTTVLINRIGYMILKKGIDPESILALTYNVSASLDMKERFKRAFPDVKINVQFRTINSIAYEIYRRYCRNKNFKMRSMLEENERTGVLKSIYRKVSGNLLISENDISFLSSHITYIKNMELSESEILEFNKDMPKFDEMYRMYRMYLKNNYKMDFDDQLVLANGVLQTDSQILKSYHSKYKYICVDEAQDTSKIQHKIISLLAGGNNIFMVGDEDQSIYGFRAAYPQALLNFKYDYMNPFIQKMEYNYRSTPAITEKAKRFIEKNTGRFKKDIVPTRENGGEVKKIKVPSRKAQFDYLLKAAKERQGKTAFLYRDNASSVLLIDSFLREKIPYIHKKSDINFFETKTVQDIRAYLCLTVNPYDVESFDRICNKGILYLKNFVKTNAIRTMQRENLPFYAAVYKEFPNIEDKNKTYVSKALAVFARLRKMNSAQSIISAVRSSGYDQYLSKQKINKNNSDVLSILAGRETDALSFLQRLKFLDDSCKEGNNSGDNPVILSTIHSSKGLEYDTVYIVDVFDGVFPNSSPPALAVKRELSQEELEERRLFYVGITRAKNNLYIMDIESSVTSFIDELFPENRKNISQSISHDNSSRAVKYAWETTKQLNERRLMRQNQKIADAKCYNEVKNKFTHDVKIVTDSIGRKWVRCDICGKIKLQNYFAVYSPNGRSICSKCARAQEFEG